MPKGPKGEKRPADLIGRAVVLAKLATGEITDPLLPDEGRTKLRRLSGGRAGRLREHDAGAAGHDSTEGGGEALVRPGIGFE